MVPLRLGGFWGQDLTNNPTPGMRLPVVGDLIPGTGVTDGVPMLGNHPAREGVAGDLAWDGLLVGPP
ncbi:hypothetical protein CRG98_035539 [Punica granatum]|uniref:Uncharacterized protein n=1 Tax=Punica granatum TaxID=22663 RepID=A0A2I0IJA4_PUNGR|nr:hypothetical protein CRG98_035539 [Punica granatum]